MIFNHNGKLVDAVHLEVNNRSFQYGDGLFERLRLFNGKVFNRKNHEKRLIFSLDQLKLIFPISIDVLFNQVEQLAQENKLFFSSGARISIYRNAGGLYTPDNLSASYIIESIEQEDNCFSIGEGIKLGVYVSHFKSRGILSNIKSSSANLYVLASLERKEKSLGELLLMNDEKCVIEGTNSNLFVIKNDLIYTPPLSDGPLAGCMRSLLKEQFNVIEKSMRIEDIMDADEVFFSNCNGIRWLSSFEGRTDYKNEGTIKAIDFLNSLI